MARKPKTASAPTADAPTVDTDDSVVQVDTPEEMHLDDGGEADQGAAPSMPTALSDDPVPAPAPVAQVEQVDEKGDEDPDENDAEDDEPAAPVVPTPAPAPTADAARALIDQADKDAKAMHDANEAANNRQRDLEDYIMLERRRISDLRATAQRLNASITANAPAVAAARKQLAGR